DKAIPTFRVAPFNLYRDFVVKPAPCAFESPGTRILRLCADEVGHFGREFLKVILRKPLPNSIGESSSTSVFCGFIKSPRVNPEQLFQYARKFMEAYAVEIFMGTLIISYEGTDMIPVRDCAMVGISVIVLVNCPGRKMMAVPTVVIAMTQIQFSTCDKKVLEFAKRVLDIR